MTAMMTNVGILVLLLLFIGGWFGIDGAPTDAVTHPPNEGMEIEARAQKQDQEAIEADDDLDGRSAYVNNQFVPNEPVDMIDEEQNAPLYEILQKQMEQVLASTGPDVPIYEEDKSKRQRGQQLVNKPLFHDNNEAATDDDYVDEPESDHSYVDSEKPDADASVDEPLPDSGYQAPQLGTSSSKPIEPAPTKQPSFSSSTIRNRPQRRRTTTSMPRTTRSKNNPQSAKVTPTVPSSGSHIEATTSTEPPSNSNHKPRPNASKQPNHNPNSNSISNSSNSLPHDPQIYQHKRRIIFKTISTGSQFVNSPIGDLMIKFSIGFAKPAQGTTTSSSEALRAISNNLMRNIEFQKMKRNRLHKE